MADPYSSATAPQHPSVSFPHDSPASSSAAAHELAAAPPAELGASSTTTATAATANGHSNGKREPNFADEDAFPALGPAPSAKGKGSAAAAAPAGASWSSRARAPKASSDSVSTSRASSPALGAARVFTESVQLPASDVRVQGAAPGERRYGPSSREPEPRSVGDVMKLLMREYPGVSVEASTSKGLTTFLIKYKPPPTNAAGAKRGHALAAPEEVVQKVKRDLLLKITPRTTEDVSVPASVRAFIIGSKGRTLKAITDETGAKVQIPPRKDDGDDDDDSEIPVTISGDAAGVRAAKARILAIVSERVSRVSVQIPSSTVAPELYPFIAGPHNAKINALVEGVGASELVTVHIPKTFDRRVAAAAASADDETGTTTTSSPAAADEQAPSISLTGDKEYVDKLVAAIEASAQELKRQLKTMTYQVNKRQHRFLVGAHADEILAQCECYVEVPAIDSRSEQVTIRGPQPKLVQGLSAVLEKISATHVESVDLGALARRAGADAALYTRQVASYLRRRGRARAIAADVNSAAVAGSNVQVFLPRDGASDELAIDIVGENAEAVEQARAKVAELVGRLPPTSFATVLVDPLLHRHVIGGKGKKAKSIEDSHAVHIVFPAEGSSDAEVLVVYAPEGSASPEEVKSALDAAAREIEQVAGTAAAIESVTLKIPASLHGAVIGEKGTTLNAVIGPDRLVNVQFGRSKGSSAAAANGKAQQGGEDEVIIRGPGDEVARVREQLERIAEDARKSEIDNSYTTSFDIQSRLVPHLIGRAGAGINKLREELGVNVDVEDDAGVEKKKATTASSKVTIKGRKENVEEAKRRMLQQHDALADEVSLTITLPPTMARGQLIGKGGMYIKRLESNYNVHIRMPRDNTADDASSTGGNDNNDIVIRGPKKGADSARKELTELIAFEREHGHVDEFDISAKAIPRVVGRGGAQLHELELEHSVTINIERGATSGGEKSTVNIKGNKAAVAKAKSQILSIAKEADNEMEQTVQIPREHHTQLIGAGGKNIRELVMRCGGPDDARLAGNMVRFPRPNEPDAEAVTVRGPSEVVSKIVAELSAFAGDMQSRIVYGVHVPQSAHAAIIGRGAAALRELQTRHNVRVIIPGWKEYDGAGPVVNADEVADAPQGEVIKIAGKREAAEACATELRSKSVAGSSSGGGAGGISRTVEVPRRHHAFIAQGGRFFRSLPRGTRISHGSVRPPQGGARRTGPPPPPPVATNGSSAPAARIDDDDVDLSEPDDLTFQLEPITSDEDDSSVPWIIESSSQENVDKVAEQVEAELAKASLKTHQAWITVPRSSMPRIVGRGGTGLDRLRAHGVDAEVLGRRDSNQLYLSGPLESVQAAYETVVEVSRTRMR